MLTGARRTGGRSPIQIVVAVVVKATAVILFSIKVSELVTEHPPACDTSTSIRSTPIARPVQARKAVGVNTPVVLVSNAAPPSTLNEYVLPARVELA